ncbi:MAG: type II secretion system protein [Rhizobacter sp.]|nr:type II secretion system protein [Rhizobacter sp.]
MRPARTERGFTYLGLLFIISVLGLTAAMASVVWSTVQRRENEKQLVFAGRQFQTAIERYGQRAQGSNMRFPRELDDLLRDPRALNMQRFLRQIYVDPITGERQWGLVRLADGSIVGVHSLSTRAPLRSSLSAVAGTRGGDVAAETYRDWRFIAPSAEALLMSGPGPAASAPAQPGPQ